MKIFILAFVSMGLATLLSIGYAQADESLLLCFSFDEGSGDEAEDSSEYGNNGTMVPKADWVDGKSGSAIQVTSGAGHVEIAPSDSLHGDIFMESFTLSAWIEPALSGGEFQHIWRSRPVESGHNTLFVNIAGYLSWRGMVGGTWTTLCECSAGAIVADEWQYVAMVSDGSNFRMYVDGELVKESNFVETDGGIQTFYVGGDAQSENYTGAIDEVTVWNRALSEDELETLRTKGVEGLVAVEPMGKLATRWSGIKVY